MKDIPCRQLPLKFGPKPWKSLVTHTCPKNLYCQKRHLGPLGVKNHLISIFSPINRGNLKEMDDFRADYLSLIE